MSSAAPLQNSAGKPQAASDMPHSSLLLQRKCACGASKSSLSGECAECGSKHRLQTKLSIGASNDPLEREADQVADQVLAAPVNRSSNATIPHIQRYPEQSSAATDTAPASVDRALANSGRSLDPALQQEMGQRFGYDFSHVRIHSGAEAEQSARDVHANAYTVGHNIVFGAGQYSPAAQEGRRLLAHELTHVVQQGESRAPSCATQTLRAQPKKGAPAKKKKPKVAMTCGRPSRKVAGNEITQVNLDVGANTLTIDWKDPKTAPTASAGTHNISPGTGLCCVDCDDDKVSQTSGTLCTPKGGSWPVFATGCALAGHPTAKNPTYFQRASIAIHSGNTSSPPRSHGCSRTSEEISELIHDNVVVDKTMVASSGTWASSKCYMNPSTDTLSKRKDVCDGNKLKPKKPAKKKGKAAAPNVIPQEIEPPKKLTPAPAKPTVAPDTPVAETPQLEDDEMMQEQSMMLADGPGPDNDPASHENLDGMADGESDMDTADETV